MEQAQINEWFDNPVTQHFFSVLKQDLKELEAAKLSAFVQGEPFVTQDRLSYLAGSEDVLSYCLGMEQERMIEVYEHIGDQP